LQLIEMSVRDDHHVPRGVRIGIQDDEAIVRAMNDKILFVVAGLHSVAEDASRSLFGGRHIGISPRGPEIIHHWAG
jgi:hypothetical protein